MGKIKNDFMLKELRRLVLCAIGLVVCMFVLLRYYSKLAPYQPLLLLGIVAIIGSLRSAILACVAISNLTDNDTYLLEKEYSASHAIYKVWQGEIHLLQSLSWIQVNLSLSAFLLITLRIVRPFLRGLRNGLEKRKWVDDIFSEVYVPKLNT